MRKYVFNYSAYKEDMTNLVKTNETVLAQLKQEREKANEERLVREERVQEVSQHWLCTYIHMQRLRNRSI